MHRFILCACFTLCALTLSAQEPTKPQISKITALPAEAPLSLATCTASRSGYLEKKGTKMKEAEMAKFITFSLREGYVLTIYPESKSGIFVNMECPASANSKATPSRP
jgi:hypothetical protein